MVPMQASLTVKGLNLQSRLSDKTPAIQSCRKQRSSTICAAASGQTQTVLREAPTITRVPVKDQVSPKIDDGGDGFPPNDGDDGGGGGGGGGNWGGGFFLFGFLAFLGFLKDEEGNRESRN